MTRWTIQQFEEWSSRQAEAVEAVKDLADPGPESRLQARIVAWAKEHGFPCLSFRQSRRAKGFLTVGWPDVTIALPSKRVVFLELKAAKGVVKDEQRSIHLQLMALGHEVHVCRSFKRFLEIVKTPAGAGA